MDRIVSNRAFALAVLVAVIGAAPAHAQDIRGFENCTAEKDMARRTGCMQSNASLMHDMLTKEIRRAQAAEAGAAKEAAALKTEVAALKASLEAIKAELAELKKAKATEPAKK